VSWVTSADDAAPLTARVDVIPNLYRRLVLDALFPIGCAGCGAPGAPVCTPCTMRLRRPPAAPPPPGVDGWAAAFAYDGPARELVARVKYRNARATLPWIAAHAVDALRGSGALDDHDVKRHGAPLVTWAPTTPARRRARGFDPAELLARAVCRQLLAPCHALLRRLPGPPQTGLAAADRRAGPRFVPSRSARRRLQSSRSPVVVVVDDVATTGATLSASALTLRSIGVCRVVALTAARTPAPGYR
jgi:predicted amidophosphoribosyltransferase